MRWGDTTLCNNSLSVKFLCLVVLFCIPLRIHRVKSSVPLEVQWVVLYDKVLVLAVHLLCVLEQYTPSQSQGMG